MKFCEECHNMLYISQINPTELIYLCKYCGNTQKSDPEDLNIFEISLSKNEDVNYIVNEYTKYDMTLPRVQDMNCPNTECPSLKDETKKDIMYIRYNEEDMKYLYLCGVCNHHWTLNKSLN